MSQDPEEIAYIVAGPLNPAAVRRFFNKHPNSLGKDGVAAWEDSSTSTAVLAIASPRTVCRRICGAMLVDFQRHHIRLDYVMTEPSLRRKRIARNMYTAFVIDPRFNEQFPTVSAQCADDDDVSISLLKSFGFQAISVLPGQTGQRDSYLFSWSFADRLKDFTGETENDSVDPDPAAGPAVPDGSKRSRSRKTDLLLYRDLPESRPEPD